MTKYRILFSWNVPKNKQQLKSKTMTNAEKAMENGLWVGKKVWDSHRHPGVGGVVKAIFDDEEYPVIVKFRANNARYTADRRWSLPHQPTLSDEPYEIPIKINKAPEWSPQEWEVALFRDEKGKPWVAERLERITESGQFLCYSGTLYRQARPFAQHLIGMAENPPFTPESIGTFAQGGLVNPLNTAPCRVRIPAKSDPTGATPDRPAN